MAEDKRITRKGVRQMMRPKPHRVTGRDPYKPAPPTSDGGTDWYSRHRMSLFIVDEVTKPFDYAALERHLLRKQRRYRTLADLKLVIERRRDKVLAFPAMYGAGADQLRSVLQGLR